MKTRAAVATAAGKPLEVMEVELEGPREGEVLVEIKATGICHTDEFTLSGADPEGLFPAILGHEGAGVVVDVGKGVTSVKKGDHVIPLYTPECRQCPSCLSRKTNLCTAIRATQGQGVMPDGTSRFSIGKDKIHHYMGCSTFSNFTVLPEIALAKVDPAAPFDKICYIGCGVTTGIGAVINTAKVEAGATAAVFGLGGIGLNVIQGLKLAGADMIIGVDTNNDKKAWGERFGMTHFVNPKEVGDVVPHLVNMTKRGADQIGGADYTFDCTGNVTVMRQALEAVSGPGASFVMAPFVHCSPLRPGRFTDGSYGIYYAGDSENVALAETIHHHQKFMGATAEEPGWTSDFRALVGSVDRDLDDVNAVPGALDPDDYSASQAEGRALRDTGSDGLTWNSVRMPGGCCIGAFWPDVVGIPVQGRHYCYHWDGSRVDFVRQYDTGTLLAVI